MLAFGRGSACDREKSESRRLDDPCYDDDPDRIGGNRSWAEERRREARAGTVACGDACRSDRGALLLKVHLAAVLGLAAIVATLTGIVFIPDGRPASKRMRSRRSRELAHLAVNPPATRFEKCPDGDLTNSQPGSRCVHPLARHGSLGSRKLLKGRISKTPH